MARVTVNEAVPATTTVARRRGPVLWRFVPVAFYLLAFTLIRGDLARGNVADLSLHLYFAAMALYVGGMFAYATSKWAVRGMSKLAATELA